MRKKESESVGQAPPPVDLLNRRVRGRAHVSTGALPPTPISADLQLTPNFRLREFAVSAEHPEIARAMRFSELEVIKIFYLCSFILQPVRSFVGRPVHILSGKRTPELNALIGGSKTSQHLDCEAADFTLVGQAPSPVQEPSNPFELKSNKAFIHKTLPDVFRYLAVARPLWRQLIIYHADEWVPRFIHISIAPSPVLVGQAPRLSTTKRKGAFYHHRGQFFRVELK